VTSRSRDGVNIGDRLAQVHERIGRAAERAGRQAGDVELVAVSKGHSPGLVRAAAEAGQQVFGENRIEEATPKMLALSGLPIAWDMIGHVQSRKAAGVIEAGMRLIHSVDSLKLARRLSRLAQQAGRRQRALLEFNVSGEAAKSGFVAHAPELWEAVLPDIAEIGALPGLAIEGCMTMAPIVPHPDAARVYFARLRDLRDYLAAHVPGASWGTLSMGMTDDFEAAIAEGATVVRVGRAIFGERQP
jgi:PLP dependent protein